MTFSDSSLPPVLPEDAAPLVATVVGSVLLPGGAGYDDERAVFNLNHELVPAVIVVPESAADVQAAVTFAAGQRRPVLVKTTGHQIVGLGFDLVDLAKADKQQHPDDHGQHDCVKVEQVVMLLHRISVAVCRGRIYQLTWKRRVLGCTRNCWIISRIAVAPFYMSRSAWLGDEPVILSEPEPRRAGVKASRRIPKMLASKYATSGCSLQAVS